MWFHQSGLDWLLTLLTYLKLLSSATQVAGIARHELKTTVERRVQSQANVERHGQGPHVEGQQVEHDCSPPPLKRPALLQISSETAVKSQSLSSHSKVGAASHGTKGRQKGSLIVFMIVMLSFDSEVG